LCRANFQRRAATAEMRLSILPTRNVEEPQKFFDVVGEKISTRTYQGAAAGPDSLLSSHAPFPLTMNPENIQPSTFNSQP
jgi:hypothetical protein